MNKIINGSISDMAQRTNQPPAVSFMDADLLVLMDVSGSMCSRDGREGRSRHDVARDELITLQGANEGKIALICFSDTVQNCFDGNPIEANGTTNLTAALDHIKIIDGSGMQIILVSDGEPNSKAQSLKIAATFETEINTIFVGPESDRSGREFLDKLSKLTGGQSIESDEIGSLKNGVTLLLGVGNE